MHNLWESMQNNASSSRAILSLAYPVTLVGYAHKDPMCLPACLLACLPRWREATKEEMKTETFSIYQRRFLALERNTVSQSRLLQFWSSLFCDFPKSSICITLCFHISAIHLPTTYCIYIPIQIVLHIVRCMVSDIVSNYMRHIVVGTFEPSKLAHVTFT
jgi:hypothetical protein